MSDEEEKNFTFSAKEQILDPLVSLWSASVDWIRQHIVNELISLFYHHPSQEHHVVDPVVIVDPITTTKEDGEDDKHNEVCFRTIPDIPNIPDIPDIACECGERCGGEELQKGGGEEGTDL